MLGDLTVDQIRSNGFNGRERSSLIKAHQAAVADDIGGKNSGKASFHLINKQSFQATVEAATQPTTSATQASIRLCDV